MGLNMVKYGLCGLDRDRRMAAGMVPKAWAQPKGSRKPSKEWQGTWLTAGSGLWSVGVMPGSCESEGCRLLIFPVEMLVDPESLGLREDVMRDMGR